MNVLNEELISIRTTLTIKRKMLSLSCDAHVKEQLKKEIKDLRIRVLDSIHEADEIKCTCNPCVVEECVKKEII